MMLTRMHCTVCGGNIAHDPLERRYYCLQCGRDALPNGQPIPPSSPTSPNTGPHKRTLDEMARDWFGKS